MKNPLQERKGKKSLRLYRETPLQALLTGPGVVMSGGGGGGGRLRKESGGWGEVSTFLNIGNSLWRSGDEAAR